MENVDFPLQFCVKVHALGLNISIFFFNLKEHNSVFFIQLTEELDYITTNLKITIIIQQQLCSLEKQMFRIHMIKIHEIINKTIKEINYMFTKLLHARMRNYFHICLSVICLALYNSISFKP